MKRPSMAQCHKICLFLEHRVTFAMIYVKFNNHKRIISYSLWKGHGEMKISPWKKNFCRYLRSGKTHTFQIKENTNTHVWRNKSRLGALVYASYLRSFNCTRLKCTRVYSTRNEMCSYFDRHLVAGCIIYFYSPWLQFFLAYYLVW